MYLRWLALSVVVWSVGCKHFGEGRFDKDAFYHGDQPIRVRYQDPARLGLLGPDWFVDNFSESDGMPDDAKTGSDYRTTYWVDDNQDGEYTQSDEVLLNDLLLEHRHHDGRIWLRAFPVATHSADKELRVLMTNHVRAMAGPTVIFNVRDSGVSVGGHSYATRLLSMRSCEIAGREALVADYERADVDQLELSPDSRDARVRLVLIRTGYDYEFRRSQGKFASFLLVGYANAPEDFARGEGDFERFLGAIELGTVDRDAPRYARGYRCDEPSAGSESESPAPAPVSQPDPTEGAAPEPSTPEIESPTEP